MFWLSKWTSIVSFAIHNVSVIIDEQSIGKCVVPAWVKSEVLLRASVRILWLPVYLVYLAIQYKSPSDDCFYTYPDGCIIGATLGCY